MGHDRTTPNQINAQATLQKAHHVAGQPANMQRDGNTRLSYRAGVGIGLITVIVLGVCMLFYEIHWQAGPGPYVEKLSDSQQQSMKVMLDLSQLLMTWALAIIGATAFFLRLNVEKGLPLSQVDLFFSLAIIVAAVLSLFFGHLGIDRTSELLALSQFPVKNEGLRQIGKLQYLSFFTAVLLFGFHIFRFFWARITMSTAAQSMEVPQ